MPLTAINDVRLYWDRKGESGDPLVLVHGSWTDHHTWDLVASALSSSFRVLTYDRRGHGNSERPPGQGSVREDVADLAALITHLDFAPAYVVGSSFGASIVLRLAAERPDLFRSLFVHEPPLFRLLDQEPSAATMLQIINERAAAVLHLLDVGDASGAARQFVETIAFGPGAWDQLSSALRETFVFNAPTFQDEMKDPEALGMDLAALRHFTHLALLSLGEQSPPFFSPVMRKVAEALPNSEVKTFAGAGHVPHVSHPLEYVEAVKNFAGVRTR